MNELASLINGYLYLYKLFFAPAPDKLNEMK